MIVYNGLCILDGMVEDMVQDGWGVSTILSLLY